MVGTFIFYRNCTTGLKITQQNELGEIKKNVETPYTIGETCYTSISCAALSFNILLIIVR